MYLANCAVCIITVRRDNEIEWDRRSEFVRSAGGAVGKWLPFHFSWRSRDTSDAASLAVSLAILDRAFAQRRLETINCHASERTRNEKRQMLERRGPKAVRIILSSSFRRFRYCPEQRDTFAVTAASRPLRAERRGGFCHGED